MRMTSECLYHTFYFIKHAFTLFISNVGNRIKNAINNIANATESERAFSRAFGELIGIFTKILTRAACRDYHDGTFTYQQPPQAKPLVNTRSNQPFKIAGRSNHHRG